MGKMPPEALSFRMRICILDAMRYIDATCGRMNRHFEGKAAFVATRVAMPTELVLQGGQTIASRPADTEVLLTV